MYKEGDNGFSRYNHKKLPIPKPNEYSKILLISVEKTPIFWICIETYPSEGRNVGFTIFVNATPMPRKNGPLSLKCLTKFDLLPISCSSKLLL